MADRFERQMRVAEKMHFLTNAPTFVLGSLPEAFFRSILEDLQRLFYSFLDEKRWMEAGDYLTQAIMMYDIIKRIGHQKKDDSKKEENIFLLRAACGLKLNAYDVSLKDASKVLEGDPDNRYAQEIKLLGECEMTLMDYRIDGLNFHIRGRLEKTRRDIERLSDKGRKRFQWDQAHFDRVRKQLDDILGPKTEVSHPAPAPAATSWASRVKNQQADGGRATPTGAPKSPQEPDETWIPKQSLPKQTQAQKPAKSKKKSRSRRQNRPRREVEEVSVGGESTEEETETETDTDDSPSSARDTPERGTDISGLDFIPVVSPTSKSKKKKTTQLGLDEIEDFGYKTPNHKHSPPKHSQQRSTLTPPRPQTPAPVAQVLVPPPPKVSEMTHQWLAGYEFRLACEKCFVQTPNQFGTYAYRLNRGPAHKPVCKGVMLVCLLHVPPKYNGVKDVYGRVRPRTKPDFKGRYNLCQQFTQGLPCKISAESCWFPHSDVEMEVWEADRNGQFNGKELVQYLNYKHRLEVAEIIRNKQALNQAKAAVNHTGAVRGTHPQNGMGAGTTTTTTTAPPGAYPHNPPSVVRVAPPTAAPPSPAPVLGLIPNPAAAAAGKKHPPVQAVLHDKLTNLIKNLGGQFLFLCRLCFGDAPQQVSVQNPVSPDRCTGEKAHKWNGPNRCLVHRLSQGGYDRFWKVRKRPNGIPPKAFLCWHRNKNYGCPIGSKCHFAHNEVEVCVWLFEAYQPLDRELLVRINHEMIYGPATPSAQHTTTRPVQPAMAAAATPPPKPPPRPVFQFKIKVVCGMCYTRTKQHFERNPRKPTQCAGPNSHMWGKDLVYFAESPGPGGWVKVVPRHPRLRPEVEPVLCRRQERCQYKEIHSNQCMFPHCEVERLLWIYQGKAKVKTVEEVYAIQQEAQGKTVHHPTAAGDASAAMATAGGLPRVPQPMKTSQFLCSYCDKSFHTKRNYDQHVGTMEHKLRIKSDTERTWKYRSPPLNVTNGQYKLCQSNLKNMCDYSRVVQERNDCPLAHGEEELEEWKERHEYRLMKIAKAKEQKLFSFVDVLLSEYNRSSNAEYEVMAEEIAGIGTKCAQNLKALLPVKERSHGQELTYQWDFDVHSERKSLRRVGLLYDEHRFHFHLSQPKDEDRPQVCPGGLISELGGTTFHITVNFHSRILGLFHQWVVFDFGEKPVLVRKLSIHIGSSSELERVAKQQQQTREIIKLWDSGNSQIIPFRSPTCKPELHEWEKKLIADYKQPSTLPGLEDAQSDRKLNEDTYKHHMHRMLNLEELECMERLTKYASATEMLLSEEVELAYSEKRIHSDNGELFGLIRLEVALFDDSETAQIVDQRVYRVLIKFDQESDVAYEALIVKKTSTKHGSYDVIHVQLSAQCVRDQKLRSFLPQPSPDGQKVDARSVPIVVQFQLDRLSFVYQHHAVDNISCMTTLFPPYPQKDKFEYVSWQEIEHKGIRMNPRQEKAARFISSAGGLHGNSSFRGKGPVIIFGPFGTGKTYTMAYSVIRTLLCRNDSRILICTRSNSAADLYITDYLDQFCRDRPDLVRMVRMYAVQRQRELISDVVLRYTLQHKDGRLRHPYDKELQDWADFAKTQTDMRNRTPNIVIATLSTAVHLTRTTNLREYFTHIVVDEAGQVLETEAIIPLQLATNDTCVVLAGDHKQISPKVHSSRARAADFHVSLLKRLFSYSRKNKGNFDLLLTYNYRSCREILDFLASYYYHAHLEARGTHPRHPMFYPLNFCVVKGEDRLIGTSFINDQEMLEVAFRVEDLCRNWPQSWGPLGEDGIAVLTPYTLQGHVIRGELRRRGLPRVTVDTVQNVQGKQFRAVVISTVRTRQTVNKAQITAIPQATGNQHENEFYYAFLSDEHLLTTAFTRAKSLIFVVGDPVALCSVGGCHMTWKRYIQECENNRSIMPADTTVEMIKEEIAAVTQRLQPTAAPFNGRRAAPIGQQARASPSPAARAGGTASAASGVETGFWSRSARAARQGAAYEGRVSYQRLNSDEFPELPEVAPAQVHIPSNLSDSDEEDEFEDAVTDIQVDDLLKELRHQVKMDFQEEMDGRKESSESDSIDSEPETAPEATPPPKVLQRGQRLPSRQAPHTQQPAPTLHVEDAVSTAVQSQGAEAREKLPEQLPKPAPKVAGATPSAPEINITQQSKVPQFRMVERGGAIRLLPISMPHRSLSQVENYDSDEDEAYDTQAEQTEDDFLEKTFMEPEKFRVCTFRYDMKGATYAIPHERTATEVVSITSKKRRGQALDNDEVVVEILDHPEAPERVEGVEELVREEEEQKIYGKVVHILKRDSDPYLRKLVCTLDPFSDNLMVPVDRTFPKLYITKSEDKAEEERDKNVAKITLHTISRAAAKTQGKFTPDRDVYVTNKERPHKLFVVRFWTWYPKTPYPMGVVIEELKPGTNPRQGLHILKLIHNVKDKFKVSVDQYLQARFPPGWSIPQTEIDRRQDFRGERIFTIDPPDSEDLDDALSIEALPGHLYKVGIHIADVSYFIPKGSDLDEEARVRATSFYPSFYEKPVHMLPKKLSTDLCSLLPNKDRLALSLTVVLNGQGQLAGHPNVFRTVVRSCQKLAYKQAEAIIHGETPQGLEDLVKPIQMLHQLARNKRATRLGDKKFVFHAEDDDGDVQNPLAHSLVEEMMILANDIIADHLLVQCSDCTPLRRQLAPPADKVDEWKETHKSSIRNSILLKASLNHNEEHDIEDEEEDQTLTLTKAVWEEVVQSSSSLVSSEKAFEKLSNLICIDQNHPQQAVALSQFHRIMERSEYVNSGDHPKPEDRSHFSLKLKAYVHFTSPIRRFIDLVVHRLLIASLEGLDCPYEARELTNITHNCSSRAVHCQRFSKESRSLQLALKLQEAPLQLLTFVENFSDKGLKLLFPHRSYILPSQCNLQFNILKPSSRPETCAASESVDLSWKSRIYDIQQDGKQRHGHRKEAIQLDTESHVVHVPEDNWEDIQNSVKLGNPNEVKRAVEATRQAGGQELNRLSDPMQQFSEQSSVEVTCEYVDMTEKQQYFIEFCRSFRRGDVLKVQVHARLFKGVLHPHIQLFNMTPQLDLCAEHRANPVLCFSDVATKIPGRERSIAAYKKTWLPILSMVSACSAVVNDDTVTIHHVDITWQKRDGGVYEGYFNIPMPFVEQRFIRFFALREEKNRRPEEDRDDNIQLDFVCVRYRNLPVSGRKLLKMRDLDNRSKHEETIGPYNRNAWAEQCFVGHGHTTNVQVDSKANLLTVTLQLHTMSIPFPEDMLLYQQEGKQRSCTIELIPKPMPDRRLEEAVRQLPHSTPLIRNICLHKPCKPDDSVFSTNEISKAALTEGAKKRDLKVAGTTLQPLNKPQEDAVRTALKNNFTLIQGPPGTGKTVTGAYLAYFFTQINQRIPAMGKGKPQVLYCGPSNKAVDVIATYLQKFDVSIVRVYSEVIEDKMFPVPGLAGGQTKWKRSNEATVDQRLTDISLHNLIRRPGARYAQDIHAKELHFQSMTSVSQAEVKDYKRLIKVAEENELKRHAIVLCTCNTAGGKRIREFTNIIQCIVDEAGMCNEPETLVPLTNTLPHQIVLIGDHKQLRPIITEPNARDLMMWKSLLEKYKHKAKMLTIQYRMHEAICEFPSETFYEGRLQTDRSVHMRSPDPLRALWPNHGQTPTVFCHVYGKEETLTVKSDEGNEMSKGNMAEMGHATRIVNQLIRRGAKQASIVVLSQYKLQCTQIEQRLKVMGYREVKVSTVVTSQGSEWDYVVLSTVRSMPQIEIDEKPSKGWQRKHLGFIMDENQMNVALTRAKRGLIVIGNKHLLETHYRWRELIKKYDDQGCVMEARNFPPFGRAN